MHAVLIAIGSNHQQAAHIQWACQRLSRLLTELQLSPRLWTADIHGSGSYYMNQLAYGHTTMTADRLTAVMKDIEAATGRSRQHVTLDLDLMLYDTQHYHLNDWDRPYIQQLLPFVHTNE